MGLPETRRRLLQAGGMNADAIEILLAKGLSGSDILEVARALESATKPKSKAALRQARYRERKEAENVTNDVTGGVTNPPNDIYSNPPPSVTKVTSGDGVKRASRDEYPKPEWADQKIWDDFKTNRKRKGKPNTASAYKRFCNDIARLSDDEWPPGRLLEHAAAEGWAGIYDPRDKSNGSHNGHARQSNPKPRTEPALELLRNAEAALAASASRNSPDSGGHRLALPDYLTN